MVPKRWGGALPPQKKILQFGCSLLYYYCSSLFTVSSCEFVCGLEPAVPEAAVNARRVTRWSSRHASIHELRPPEVLGGKRRSDFFLFFQKFVCLQHLLFIMILYTLLRENFSM